MRRREGVVDVDIAELRELLDERRIVLFLFLVEAGVLQQQHVAVLHRGDSLFGSLADAVVREADVLLEDVRDLMRDGLERLLRVAALRTAEVREQDHLAALVGDFLDGRHDALDARRIGDLAILHRHVEVDAHQHALAGDISGIEGAEAGHCLKLTAAAATCATVPAPRSASP